MVAEADRWQTLVQRSLESRTVLYFRGYTAPQHDEQRLRRSQPFFAPSCTYFSISITLSIPLSHNLLLALIVLLLAQVSR